MKKCDNCTYVECSKCDDIIGRDCSCDCVENRPRNILNGMSNPTNNVPETLGDKTIGMPLREKIAYYIRDSLSVADAARGIEKLFDEDLQRVETEAEMKAARKIKAVINAHVGLNSDTEVLSLVESSLEVINQLTVEVDLKAKKKG